MFSPEETRRYSRHLILPEFGKEGQGKLKRARVLCVGAGGLGSPAAMYLAAAGVGTLGLIDFDSVDLSNLQRQILHGTPDVGRPKLDSARDRLSALNPEVKLRLHPVELNAGNALEIFRDYDVVLDGTDNYATRYLINDACVLLGKPNVSASVFRFEGQVSIFGAPGGPCYRCLYPAPPPPGLVPSCGEGGVLGFVPGLIGVLQATEAVKLVTGLGEPLVGRLLLFDALEMRFRELKVRKDPACSICGPEPTIRALVDYPAFCGTRAPAVREVSVQELRKKIAAGERFELLDVRNPDERELNLIPGSSFIPLPQLSERFGELDRDAELVIYCKAGGRSARAAELLQSKGFSRVSSLDGGIIAWAAEADPRLAPY